MNSLFSESNHGSYGQKDDRDASESVAPASAAAPSAGPAATDVFRYEDYRAFLRDRFIGMQAMDPSFSQRGLARKAGIANPGFFNEVIKGRRRLSPAAALKMANGLVLTEAETEFFSCLVEYAETREPRAKFVAGKRLIVMRNRKFSIAQDGDQAPGEDLKDIVRELNRDWVLQAAGLEVPQSMGDGNAAAMRPVGDGALRSILDRLVNIREQSAGPERREEAPAKPVVQVNLQVQPRSNPSGNASGAA
jgi:hypothetical protein